MHLGDTQLDSELLGRPPSAGGKLLATDLFSFGGIAPKEMGRREASDARVPGGFCGFFLFGEMEASQSMKKIIHIWTNKGGPSIPLHCLGPGGLPPPKRLASAITTAENNHIKCLPRPSSLPLLKRSWPQAVGQEVTLSNNICVLCPRECLVEMDIN